VLEDLYERERESPKTKILTKPVFMTQIDFYSLRKNAKSVLLLRTLSLLIMFMAAGFNAISQCLPAPAVPQSQGFNTTGTTTFPTCWQSTVVTNTGGSTPAVTFVTSGTNPTCTPQEGTRMVKFNSYNCYSGGQVRLESLPVNTTSVSSVDVEFYWLNDNTAYTSYLDNVQVQWSTNGTTWNNAGSAFNRPDGGSGISWNLKTVTLPAGAAGQATLYVGFLFTSDYGNNCHLDNISIKATPSCGVPTAVSGVASSSTTANLSWTAPSVGTPIGYEYVVSTSNTTPSGSGTLVTGTSTSVSSLSPNTTYYVFVRTKCGTSTFSAWTASVSFTTPCTPLPLTQFEGFTSTTIPTCWSTQLVTAGSFTTAAITFPTSGTNPTCSPAQGTNMVMFNSYNTNGGVIRLVALPVTTTSVASVDVAFKWLNDNSAYTTSFDNVQVQYSLDKVNWINAGSAFNRPDGGTGTTWNNKVVTLPSGAANQPLVYVGFLFTSQYGNNCYMDSVVIKPSPTCFTPTSLAASITSSTSATISWGPPSGGTSPTNYQYVVSTSSTAPVSAGTTVTGTSTSVGSLTPSTTYYLFVRSFCGGSDYSAWAGPVSFTTPCNSATLPVIQPFGAGLPSCWTATSSGSANWVTGTSDASHGAAGPQAGTHFAYLDVYNALTGGNPYNLTTVPITLSCHTTLYYYYFLGSNNTSGPLDVQVSTNYGTTWTTVYSHSTSNSTFATTNAVSNWFPNSLNLNTYTGQTVMIRFKGNSNYGVSICNMGIDELEITPRIPSSTAGQRCGAGVPVCSVSSNSGVSTPSYRWYTVATGGTPIAGETGATLSTYSISATTTFYVSEVVAGAESRRIPVVATVNPLPVVSTNVTNVTCFGGNDGAVTTTVTSGTPSFTYSWNTTPVQTTANISGLIAGSYTVTVTDSKTCQGTATATVTQPTAAASIPAIASQPSNRVICSGTNTTFVTSATGLNITYQWYVNTGSGFNPISNGGVYSGATTATLTITGAPVTMNGYTYYCIASGTCSPAATTNTVSLTVNQTIPTISINTSTTNICAGTSVTFNSTITNGGSTPAYQWKVNGLNVGTGSSYTTTSLANNDVVTCVLTSNATCPTPASVTSNGITMTVNPIVTPTISITSALGNTMCAGTSVTFTSAITNGGSTPTYQWKKNGNNVATGSSYTTSSIANGDVITCTLTSNANCRSTSTANSNSLTMTIIPLVTPAVSITASDTTVCENSPVLFTATPTNGGTTPTYVWRNNGIIIPGATGPTYTSSTLQNGNAITAIMTTSVNCYTSATETSTAIDMVVDPILVPSVSIVASTDTVICAGTNVTFLALPVNGGNTPVYQWRLNGNSMNGATANVYGVSILNTGDVITCDLISSYACPSIASIGSNGLKFTVKPTAPPIVGIASNSGNVIQTGETVTFTSTVINVGAAATYQWTKNDIDIPGATNSTYTTNALVDGDKIGLVVTSDMDCANPKTGQSNAVTITIGTGIPGSAGRELTEVNLYPNPNSGSFTIDATVGVNQKEASYEILNNLGQLIGKGSIEVRNGNLKKNIMMADVASGTYFIRITLGQNSVVKQFNVQ
jgi:hypothetical protein